MKEETKKNFVQAMKLLAHQTMHNYYRKLEEFPADKEFQRANGFFASVLYDVANSREPIEEEYEEYKGQEFNYQVAKGLYQNWLTVPVDTVVESYCKIVSMLIEKKAAEKCKGGFYFTFDYSSRKPDVIRELERARAEARLRYDWAKCDL